MARFAARIEISHLPGVADPQGATVERALPALGYHNVTELKIAKSIRLIVDALSADDAQRQVTAMCEQILANPVIEAYDITVSQIATP